MAYFAKLNDNNEVIGIHSVANIILVDGDGNEQESLGVEFLTKLHKHSNWKQTSYNTRFNHHSQDGAPFRKNYACVGMIYNSTIDGFLHPQPYASWTLNNSLGLWKPPLEKPTIKNDVIGGPYYEWDESLYQSDNTKGWVLITP